MEKIRHVAVLGSGVMGGGIAAHAANAGLKVTLLDIVPDDAPDRNVLSKGAVARMLAASPSAFLSPQRAEQVTCGNMEDDLALLHEADWIIEAVIERKDIKQAVYRKIDAVRKPGSVVSSNTSTIPIHELMEGLPASIAPDFCITHFFNPPRFMRLLEVVKSEAMAPVRFERICRFADEFLGKEIVPCKDTPGFIANRIGVYWMTVGLNIAMEMRVPIELADAVLGRPVGIPKTGVFGLYDLIGLDLMLLIAKEMHATLPKDDAFCQLNAEPEIIKKVIAEGYTGRKGKGGFTRIRKEGENKIRESLDLASGAYRVEEKPVLASAKAKNIRDLLAADDPGAQYAFAVLSRTLLYAASLIPEIADDIASVDAAMRSGYNWKYGPFEMMDQIGVEAFIERVRKIGRPIPPILQQAQGRSFYQNQPSPQQLTLAAGYKPLSRPQGTLMVADVKRGATPILQNESAGLWDMGDGIACFSLATKMNVWDEKAFAALESSIEKVRCSFAGMVIATDADLFSAGANLHYFLDDARRGDWQAIDAFIRRGQNVFKQLKYAPFPTVAALAGMALGGGCELLLHCSGIQAYAESYPGLVEVNVGLVPAWGGCKEMLIRHANPAAVFDIILSARTATSSDDARMLGILKGRDGVSMNRHRLLADAKQYCASMTNNYSTPKYVNLPEAPGALQLLKDKLAQKKLPPHTYVVGEVLARVLASYGSEEALLHAEREGFIELIRTAPTQARIAHMLETGKALTN